MLTLLITLTGGPRFSDSPGLLPRTLTGGPRFSDSPGLLPRTLTGGLRSEDSPGLLPRTLTGGLRSDDSPGLLPRTLTGGLRSDDNPGLLPRTLCSIFILEASSGLPPDSRSAPPTSQVCLTPPTRAPGLSPTSQSPRSAPYIPGSAMKQLVLSSPLEATLSLVHLCPFLLIRPPKPLTSQYNMAQAAARDVLGKPKPQEKMPAILVASKMKSGLPKPVHSAAPILHVPPARAGPQPCYLKLGSKVEVSKTAYTSQIPLKSQGLQEPTGEGLPLRKSSSLENGFDTQEAFCFGHLDSVFSMAPGRGCGLLCSLAAGVDQRMVTLCRMLFRAFGAFDISLHKSSVSGCFHDGLLLTGDVADLLKAPCLPNEAKPRPPAYRGVDFLVSPVGESFGLGHAGAGGGSALQRGLLQRPLNGSIEVPRQDDNGSVGGPGPQRGSLFSPVEKIASILPPKIPQSKNLETHTDVDLKCGQQMWEMKVAPSAPYPSKCGDQKRMAAFPNWELGELRRKEVASTADIASPNLGPKPRLRSLKRGIVEASYASEAAVCSLAEGLPHALQHWRASTPDLQAANPAPGLPLEDNSPSVWGKQTHFYTSL
ncbi:hypothetical protein STEG23_021723 [Scotinomys teguina]